MRWDMEVMTENITVEIANSKLWIEDGIVHSIPKADLPNDFSIEYFDQAIQKFKETIGTEKVCFLVESRHNTSLPTKAIREHIAKRMEEITLALAIVNPSPLSRMVSNLFFHLLPPAYPVKMFSEKPEALEWLKDVCLKEKARTGQPRL